MFTKNVNQINQSKPSKNQLDLINGKYNMCRNIKLTHDLKRNESVTDFMRIKIQI